MKKQLAWFVMVLIGIGILFSLIGWKKDVSSIKSPAKSKNIKEESQKSKEKIVDTSIKNMPDEKIDFENETVGAQSKNFSSFVGNWHIDKDGDNITYAVDGRKWKSGSMAESAADKAKAIYGDRYAEFLDNVQAYRYFPLSIDNEITSFKTGTISVAFKTISGRIDQAAGIAFNIKPNGNYLVVRANALEKNLVMFKMNRGKRSTSQWIRNVPTSSKEWHTLKVVIDGKNIKGYVDGKRYIDYTYKETIEGKVGLWSKADSYVLFDNFLVQTK